jgi:hypothetical protein
MFYAGVSIGAFVVAVAVLAAWAPSASRTGAREPRRRRPWLTGLGLVALGAAFFAVAAVDPPGFDLGEGLDLGALVDSMGGGYAVTGFAIALMLTAFFLLALVDPARSGRLLGRVGLAAVPFVALLTVLTALFDRDVWREETVGPLAASIFAFTLPALLAGSLLQRAGAQEEMPGRHDGSGGTLHAT